ncbi:MAG: hypothetical protein KA035_00250 [Candidatus Levybacteria bacterium]|nr:hypothetical protein [Candidatus Levybacteria bacterium]
MRERVIEIFRSLPPEGIGIHGTNLARAKIMEAEGLKPQKLHPDLPLDDVYYYVQPPNFNPTYTREHFEQLKEGFLQAYRKYAQRASTWSSYKVDSSPDSSTPALVIFKPNKVFDQNTLSFTHLPFTYIDSDLKPIPALSIYGIIPIHKPTFPSKLVMSTFELLRNQGVINSARLPLPQVR